VGLIVFLIILFNYAASSPEAHPAAGLDAETVPRQASVKPAQPLLLKK